MEARFEAANAAALRGISWQHLATDERNREHFMLSVDRPPRPELIFDAWLLRQPHFSAEELRRVNYIHPGPHEAIRVRFDCPARSMRLLAEGVPRPGGEFTITRILDQPASVAAPDSFDDRLLTAACRGAGVATRPYD